MKTKLFALIISILCLSMLLVACDKPCETHADEDNDAVCDVCGEAIENASETETNTEAATEGICEHKDTDADKICDECGKAVVVIVEQIPVDKETASEMVVNPIPEEVKVEDYISTNLPEYEFISIGTKLEGYLDHEGHYVLKESEDESGRTLSIIDIASKEYATVWSAKDGVTEDGNVKYNVSLYDTWYIVEAITFTTDDTVDPPVSTTIKTNIEVYTYANKKIGETYTWQIDSEDNDGAFVPPIVSNYGQEIYLTFQDKMFAIDPETNDILYVGDPETFIERPEFDEVNGNYGYIANYEYGNFEGVYVYDLTKWIDCVYSYVIPEKYENADFAVLQNGNILIWADVRLANAAVSYDYIVDGEKYDLVYTIIDVASKTVKDVEFGYAIEGIWSLADGEGFVTETATKYNAVVAYPVADGYVNSNEELYFLVDNDFNIVCKLDVADAILVDDNTFIKEIVYNDGKFVYELVNVNGEHIDYLAANTEWNYGYKTIGNALWSYSNKILIDFDEYDDWQWVSGGNYALMVMSVEDEEGNDTQVYYSYILGQEKKELDSSKDGWIIVGIYDFGYVVEYTETNEEDGSITYAYQLYNAKNELLLDLDSVIINTTSIEEGYIIWTADGTYILK